MYERTKSNQEEKKNVLIIGNIGNGKSTTLNKLARALDGNSDAPFIAKKSL